MIELIFSDSGAANLAYAKSTGNTSHIISTEIYTDNEGNEEITPFDPMPYTGAKIDGDISDIASLWLMGDVGDISVLPDWISRIKIIQEISDVDVYEMETDNWIEKEAERAMALVQRLCDAAESGETVRIWWSDIPHEACGYFWAMNILENSKGTTTSVKVPRIWRGQNGYNPINGTGALTPEDFVSLLSIEEEIERDERHATSMIWKTLASENAPLRVVINGLPYSVPEDFYDWVLRKALPDGDFKVVEAIGHSLIQGPGGISDWWYAKRIKHLIACNELEIVKENKKFYHSTVRKTKQIYCGA